jgi:hypothetical protein
MRDLTQAKVELTLPGELHSKLVDVINKFNKKSRRRYPMTIDEFITKAIESELPNLEEYT